MTTSTPPRQAHVSIPSPPLPANIWRRRQCIQISGDVKDSAFCNQAVEQAVQAFGGLDILVNNAAFQEHAESLLDLTDERFDEIMRTNVYGYFYPADQPSLNLIIRRHTTC
ncbi:MAG: SDR family oxidoreductase [Burkholderiaceae bacterium]|nr:SDR family oxidoreductase [Burkholderiaceae bacterium]